MDLSLERPVRAMPTVARPGPFNMAFDAVAAETVTEDGPATVRVYGWEPSTLSLGYAQDPATIDWTFIEDAGIVSTRRPTGGGGIYHDSYGDISYSVVVPRSALPDDLTTSYRMLCQPIIDALRSLGLPVGFASETKQAIHEPTCYLRELHPAHDLVLETAGGERKISGNAQHRQREAIVQHGSIRYAPSLATHAGCFVDEAASAEALEQRTTTVSEAAAVERADVVAALERSLRETFDAAPGDWTAGERTRAASLVEEQFGADSWIERQPSEA